MDIRRGFTLVELLIVIAIIGLLIAMLLPAVARVRLAADIMTDANNMRTLGMALRQYLNSHNGKFPGYAETTGSKPWMDKLIPYLESEDVFYSEYDPKVKARRNAKGSSYVINGYLSDAHSLPTDSDFINRMQDCTAQSKMMAIFHGSDRRGHGRTNDHTHAENWFKAPVTGNYQRILSDICPDRFGTGSHGDPIARRLSMGSNYLFLDGHVEYIEAVQIKAWADANFNFARPQK
ncbi:MAG TPA: type II secretion system protein [Gemmatales bacterium]|nr:type II secretion system protein [Gemmatales bacterium]HMP16692.1 type II secretion system protein [Gemmatales bacterium]